MLNHYDIEYIVKCIYENKPIPEEYKNSLFPIKQKEYELIYSDKIRKEDILSDTDEVSKVPLQVEKTFGEPSDWQNLLIFGDNLQILKTIIYDTDPLIAGKIKGKVKLIYIDPPFATEQEFKSNKGQKAYVDKARGAKFVEFLRRRLILMRELLADDGVIYIHLDYRKVHYIKIIMDEIFGENNFINEITWKRTSAHSDSGKYGINTDYILFYAKGENYTWNQQYGEYSKKHLARFRNKDEDGRLWTDSPLTAKGLSGGGYTYTYKGISGFWRCPLSTMEKLDKENRLHFTKNGGIRIKKYLDELKGTPLQTLWSDIDPINSQSKERVNYPTQKPEELIERIIRTSTKEGDIVLDCFAGSGTALAVAEKLGRRWIGCDIGKLALYTIQKRLIEIKDSKMLGNHKHVYGAPAKTFSVVSAGLYDLGKVFSLPQEKYKAFVKDLFDIEEITNRSIRGIQIDGEKRGYFVKIYPYWDEKLQNADVDEIYINNLHQHIGSKIKDRFYIIAPANNVAFVNDYYEIDNIRYYFLKVPYQVIRELHNQKFRKLRQPQSNTQINDLDEAVGFHFIRQPEVESKLIKSTSGYSVAITKFMSDYAFDESDNEINNFESLSMVLIDNNYNGNFIMSEYRFANDLISYVKNTEFEEEDEVRKQLKNLKEILIPVKPTGNRIMLIYIDIYGNEFKETFEIGG